MYEIILIEPGQTAEISPLAAGFAHGFGLFETLHYAGGQLYSWEDHWARLAHSAATFGLLLPPESEVLEALQTLVTRANLYDSTLKLSLLKGVKNSQLFIYVRPPLPTPASSALWLDLDAPIFERSPLAGHKTHNYMEAMHRLELARSRGYCDALRLDSRGRLAETTIANIFFIAAGRLCTPALDTGALPGVTRSVLSRSAELQVETGHYNPADLRGAETLFTTNATCGIQAIERLEGHPDGEKLVFNTEHPALGKIRAAYQTERSSIRLLTN